MGPNNTAKNINNLYIWIIPIIIASKVVRWTIMYSKLIWVSIGNGMVDRMNQGMYHFRLSMLSQVTNAASVAEANAGALFQAINIFGIETRDQWEVFITIVYNFLTLFVVIDFYKRTPQAGKYENIFIYLGIAILNIFCFCLAKEPYQMLFFFLMAIAIIKGKGYQQKTILLGITLLVTVLLSRKYFGLILLYYFILQYLVRYLFDNINFHSKNGKKKLIVNVIFAGGIIGICYFFLLSYLSGNMESTYDEMINANYRNTNRDSIADSEITPFFPRGNRIYAAADYVLKIFRLMFPIELLVKGKVKYLFLIVFQGLLAMFIGRAFMNRRAPYQERTEENEEVEESEEENKEIEEVIDENEDEEEDEDEDEDIDEDEDEDEDVDEEVQKRRDEDRRQTRTAALYLYLAFLFCSAAFEPDFGSWIRHQGVALPIILLIL